MSLFCHSKCKWGEGGERDLIRMGSAGQTDKAGKGQGSQICRQGSGWHSVGNLGSGNREVRPELGGARSPARVVGSMVDFRSNGWKTRESKLKKY